MTPWEHEVAAAVILAIGGGAVALMVRGINAKFLDLVRSELKPTVDKVEKQEGRILLLENHLFGRR